MITMVSLVRILTGDFSMIPNGRSISFYVGILGKLF
jgi:hypothetical protein